MLLIVSLFHCSKRSSAISICCPSHCHWYERTLTFLMFLSQITCLSYDELFNATTTRSLAEVKDVKERGSSGSAVELPSSLLEVNCVLLTPSLVHTQENQAPKSTRALADAIQGLLSAGFQYVGMRMILLRESQAEQCVKLFSDAVPAEWQPHLLVSTVSAHNCFPTW